MVIYCCWLLVSPAFADIAFVLLLVDDVGGVKGSWLSGTFSDISNGLSVTSIAEFLILV
jgi:hypothetical protein